MSAVHNAWYVQIEGQVYGPYSHAFMGDYVEEGRILPESQISADPSQGFVAARRYPQFNEWSDFQTEVQAEPQKIAVGAGMAQVAAQAYTQPAPVLTPVELQTPILTTIETPVQVPTEPVQLQKPAHASVFLVMAEIRSGQSMGFLQTLQSFGSAQRIGDTVWLVRSSVNAQDLRNALSQTLTRQDRLFVMDSFANETAWFNIGADMDTRIRQLWAGEI